MYMISAKIKVGGMDLDVVCSFDPTIVIVRLNKAFADSVEINQRDFAWKDYDAFKMRGVVEGAIRIAENDARRRGPIWTFQFRVPSPSLIRGRAERYDVSIWSDDPIPEPLRSDFLSFLNELRFCPFVTVKSVRLDGNNEFPA